MRIWIDLGNSPHIPFFLALSKEFVERGHEIVWTARDYAQTVEMAKMAGLDPTVFGIHGGKNIVSKAVKFASRVLELRKWAAGKKIDLALSHNSQEPLVVARLLGIRSVNLMDYEHHPGNHLSFRTAKKLVVPQSFPDAALRKFGVTESKVRRFDGIKEDVYLADFEPDEQFPDVLAPLGVSGDDKLVVIRPHAPEALYHRGVANQLLSEALEKFAAVPGCKIILLPRKTYQGDDLRREHPHANIIIPDRVLDGANLIAAADLVISGGGTMNREAAALGVPVATIFAGKTAAIDEYLISENRMMRIDSSADLDLIPLRKKPARNPRRNNEVRRQVADLILEA
ncbi:MAG: DUF354 domain-containing protein [Chloracidobacterium sp.]|nr:DUF354 domain-containing protein [Chloracidobacterium sp.]